METRMKPIFASGKGTPYFEAVSLNFLEELRKRGWQVYSYPAFADFWRLLQEKGGWWDPGEYPEVEWKKRKKFTFPTVARFDALLKERALLSHGQGNAKRGHAPADAAGGPDPEDGNPGLFPPGALYHPDEHDRGGSQPTAVAGDLRTDPARVLETLGRDASGESEEAFS